MSLFYEVKANLRLQQVALLAAAGIDRIQPGIESLSDHVLKLMRKGTTALQNVQLLKWCREHGVKAEWNVLYGFPGELPEDYEAMPRCSTRSGSSTRPERLRPGPARPLRALPRGPRREPDGQGAPAGAVPVPLSLPEDALMRIAYYFDYDYADGRDPLVLRGPAVERRALLDGRRTGGAADALDDGDGDIVLLDERPPPPRGTLKLRGWRARACAACDQLRSRSGLARLPELDGRRRPARRLPRPLCEGPPDGALGRHLPRARGPHARARGGGGGGGGGRGGGGGGGGGAGRKTGGEVFRWLSAR